jgi:chromosome segregation ATPase
LLEKEKGEHDFDLNSLNCKIEEMKKSKEELESKFVQEIEQLNNELKEKCETMSNERNNFQTEISKLKEDSENYVRELSIKLEMNKFNGEKLLIESHESVVRHLNEKLFADEEKLDEQSQLIENLQYEISSYQAKFGELNEMVIDLSKLI